MNKDIFKAVSGYETLSIIGMCKNAGKTTVLTHILQEFNKNGIVFGLTSIGRDGEAVDTVRGTKKPGIYVEKGAILATASQMLPLCDVTREILWKTGIPTSLGEVIFIRALSDGHVQIAGPSMVDQLASLKERFRDFGAERIIIDGAISRKSLGSTALCDGVVLCSGASYDKNMEKVVADTVHIKNLLSCPALSDSSLVADMKRCQSRFLLVYTDYTQKTEETEPFDRLHQGEYRGLRYIYVAGAITDALANKLAMAKEARGLCLVAADSSKLLLNKPCFEKLQRAGVSLTVLTKTSLAAVTINPFSAYGFHFNKDLFKNAMEQALGLPVINVEDTL